MSPHQLSTEPAARLRLAIVRLQRLLRHNAAGDLGLTDHSCLALIGHDGPMPLGEVATREHLTAPAVTKITDRLVAKGLVERRPSDEDRRVVLVALTPRGAALIDELRARATSYLASRVAELDSADRDALEAALPVLERLAQGIYDPS